MRRWWTVRMWRGPAVAFLMVMGALAMAMPARAAASSSSPTVSVAMQNGSTFAYGSNVTPSFTVVVTFAAPPTAGYVQTARVSVDSAQARQYGNANNPTESADHLTYTFRVDSNDSQISVGSHTAQASYFEAQTNSWVLSGNIVTFSITKGTPALNCLIQNGTIITSPGQSLQIEVDASAQNTSVPVNGTFSIRFTGPTTVTDSGLHPDSNNLVMVPAPAQIGNYKEVWCIFEGNASFNSGSMIMSGQPVLVSEKRQMGGAEFFSDPTTLIAYQPADVYVVFHAGAGLPTPTGYFHINLGDSTTNAVALGPNGDLLLHLDRIPRLAGVSQIDVAYQGDPYYDVATFHFPLTNPPIPVGNSGSGGGSQAKAPTTASATGAPAATVTVGDSALPTATATGPTTALATQSGNGSTLWLWVALGVLVLGGGAGGCGVSGTPIAPRCVSR